MGASFFFFFSSRRRHTRCSRDWSSDVCSSDLYAAGRRPSPEMEPYAKYVLEAGVDDLASYFASQPRRPTAVRVDAGAVERGREVGDRKSTRLNSSHGYISYAVFCLKKKKTRNHIKDSN